MRLARAELRWLAGQPQLALEEARSGCEHARGHVDPWTFGSVTIWLHRLDEATDPADVLPEPYARERDGAWEAAATEWDRLGRPYEAALARLSSSDESALREASAFSTIWAPGQPLLWPGAQ